MSWENKQIKPFTFYCQKILPLVYDESLSYYETLCKIQKVLNEVIENENSLNTAFQTLLEYVNTQLETYAKEQLEEWLDDGTLGDIITEELLKTYKVVNVKEYGAKGDGITDDTIAIQNAVNSCLDGGTIYFPSGIYIIDGFVKSYEGGVYDLYTAGIKMKNNITVYMDNSALVKLLENQDYPTSVLFNCYNCTNVKFINCKIEGDLSTHDMSRINGSISTDEWGFGIVVKSSTDIKIIDCIIYNCMGDGIYICNPSLRDRDYPIDYHNKNINIIRPKIYNVRRNGISVTDCISCNINEADISNIQGTAPKSGIDIEGEGDLEYIVKNIKINNLNLNNCDIGINILNANDVFINNVYCNDITGTYCINANNGENINIFNINSDKGIILQTTYNRVKNSNINNILCHNSYITFIEDCVMVRGVDTTGNSEVTVINCLCKGSCNINEGTGKLTLNNVNFDSSDVPIFSAVNNSFRVMLYNCRLVTTNTVCLEVGNETNQGNYIECYNCYFESKVNVKWAFKCVFINCFFNSLPGGNGNQLYAVGSEIVVNGNIFNNYLLTGEYHTAMSINGIFCSIINNMLLKGSTQYKVGVFCTTYEDIDSKCLITQNYFNGMCETPISLLKKTNEEGVVNYD